MAMTPVSGQEMSTAADVLRRAPVAQASNGICFAMLGETAVATADLERMISTVPKPIAATLDRKAYYFVPLVAGDDETMIAERYDATISDRAVCHRNFTSGDSQCVFISTRLMQDKFSVAFEFYINVGHAFVERAGVAESFAELAWKQAEENVRGETSMDAFEFRKTALRGVGEAGAGGKIDEKAKSDYLEATFADSIAIYLLSLCLDVDYYELREREYPLLAPKSLAERLKKINELFPPNPGYAFAIHYRRRNS